MKDFSEKPIDSFVVRELRAATGAAEPETHVITDGKGKPMIFTKREDAEALKKQLEKRTGAPEVSYSVEQWKDIR
jgi:hypothetical protein